MAKPRKYINGLLIIEVLEEDDHITAIWLGKSVEREPGKILTPILVRLVRECSEKDKRLILDFRSLAYLNSSTITPIIKILERAKRGSTKVTVIYDVTLKWQDLIFSALTIFKTKDDRVQLRGISSK